MATLLPNEWVVVDNPWDLWVQKGPTYTTTGTVTIPPVNWNWTATTGTSVSNDYVINYRASTTITGDQAVTWKRWQVAERIAALQAANYADLVQAELLQQRAELADRQQRYAEERSAARLAQAQKYEGAQSRALELLKMILTPEEHLLFENTGTIAVRGSEGGLYEIDTRRGDVHGNVVSVDEHGCRLGRLCAAPRMYDEVSGYGLPLADGWVGQYLTLKHNESEFLRHANWSGRRACQHPGVPVLGSQRAA